MNYLLDTNVVIALLRNRPAMVRERYRDAVTDGGSISVSSVVLCELWYGVALSDRRQENSERLRVFLAGVTSVLAFQEADGSIAGDLRAELEKGGKSIGQYDLLVAAQALRAGVVLVTANVSEFARVTGLVWQDWTVGP